MQLGAAAPTSWSSASRDRRPRRPRRHQARRARQKPERHRPALDAIAGALLHREIPDADEVVEIITAAPANPASATAQTAGARPFLGSLGQERPNRRPCAITRRGFPAAVDPVVVHAHVDGAWAHGLGTGLPRGASPGAVVLSCLLRSVVGDLRSELTLVCRWLLEAIDQQRDLLQVIERDGGRFPA